MKTINTLAWKLSLCAILFAAANCARADFWRWTRPFRGPDQNIQTLIVTGNYATSRLLAELIQKTNKQPILLVPADNSNKIYFMPPPSRAKPLTIKNEQLTNFINFLRPKQIMILGDKKFVPKKYTDEIGTNQIVWRLTGDNWKKMAASAGRLLNLTNVSGDYETLFAKLKNEVNYTGEGQVQGVASANTDMQILPTAETTSAKQALGADNEPIQLIDASQK